MLRRVVLASAAVLLTLTGCHKNVATGKNIFAPMSIEKQIALGNEAGPQFTQEYGGEVPNGQLKQYVNGIGQKLAAETEAPFTSIDWSFTLLNSPVVNAFALPGGKVFFSRGLAEQLTNEAQMAGVIGHEIGHVTAEHGAQRISQQTAFNVGMVITAVAVGVSGDEELQDYASLGIPALTVGGNLVILKYSRDQELEADRLGVRYMANVGYDPRGQLEVMQVLARLSQGDRPPALLSTHPAPEARVEQIQKMLQTEYAHTQGNPNYKDFADRYRSQFLGVIKAVPPPPAPPQASLMLSAEEFAPLRRGAFEYDDPTTWCAHCRALPPTGAKGTLAASASEASNRPVR